MKNKTFPFLTLCAWMALTISCTGTSGNDAVVSLGDTNNPVKYRDYIKSVELTLLHDDTTCLVGKIEKVLVRDDEYLK